MRVALQTRQYPWTELRLAQAFAGVLVVFAMAAVVPVYMLRATVPEYSLVTYLAVARVIRSVSTRTQIVSPIVTITWVAANLLLFVGVTGVALRITRTRWSESTRGWFVVVLAIAFACCIGLLFPRLIAI